MMRDLIGGAGVWLRGHPARRDNLEQGIIGGMVGGAAVIIAALGLRAGFSRSDIFALAGGLLGVAIPIAGAVWIEDRKRRVDRREAAQLMVEPLDRIVAQIDAIADTPPSGAMPTARALGTELDAFLQLAKAFPPSKTSRLILLRRFDQAELFVTGEPLAARLAEIAAYPNEARPLVELYPDLRSIAAELAADYRRDL